VIFQLVVRLGFLLFVGFDLRLRQVYREVMAAMVLVMGMEKEMVVGYTYCFPSLL
jgi:hypothetical protein